MTPEPIRVFEVELTITARVPASNAGDAIVALAGRVREGIGPDDPEAREKRSFGAAIAHGRATVTSVMVPEKRGKTRQEER